VNASVLWGALLALVIATAGANAQKCPRIPNAAGLGFDRPLIVGQPDWERCLSEAADDFSVQSELAQTVVDAAFGTCLELEAVVRKVMGEENCAPGLGFVGAIEEQILKPRLLARVMAARAARARSQKAPPRQDAPRPAIDYNRM
jgi:hypothetical protein